MGFESNCDPFGAPDGILYPCTGASCSRATPSREIEVTQDQGQMSARGWTRRQISEAVRTGEPFAAENRVN